MDPKVNYTVVGIFVVISLIAASFLIVSLLAGTNNHRQYQSYIVYVKESVSGLSEQSDVKYNGVKIGSVAEITLDTNQPETVKILLNIDTRYPLHEGTTATIETQGLTGLSYIGLSGVIPDSPLLQPRAGERYARIPYKPSLLFNLNQTLRHVVAKIDTITESVHAVLNEHNQAQIKIILDNMANLSTTLRNNDQHIAELLSNANHAMDNIAKTSKDFPALSQQAQQSLQHLNHALANVEKTLNHVERTFKKGETFIDNASRQIMPKLYDNLDNIAEMSTHLKSLSRELKANPAILIRGKKPQGPRPGE